MSTNCWRQNKNVVIDSAMNDITKIKNESFLHLELQKEFLRRRKINQRYSLRAYANFLEIDQSLLSKIMNRQRAPSATLVEKISAKLRLRSQESVSEIQNRNLLSSAKEDSPLSQRSLQGLALNTYINLLEDEVNLLENWLHFAVLELVKTKDFKPDAKWMAQRFGVHKNEMEDVLSRLARRGFIRIGDKKITLVKANVSWIESLTTSEARRELQRQLLKKSLESLDENSFKDREHTSLTVAVPRNQISEFKKKLNEICLELDSYFQPHEKESDEVYQVSLSFFPLTKLKKTNNEIKDKK